MVQEIYQNVEQVINTYVEKLRHHIRVDRVILFGSYARGTPRPWSDIDLAIISPDFHGGTEEDCLLLDRVAREVTPMIEALPYRPEDFDDADSRSFEAALAKQGKLVYPKMAA